MNSKEIVREIMKEKGISQEKLALKCRMKRQSNITGVLNSGASLRVDTLEQMVKAMGYEIVIREKLAPWNCVVVNETEDSENGPQFVF